MPEITNEEAINGMHKAEDAARGGYSSCDSKNSVRFAVGSIRWDQFQRVLHLAECWVALGRWLDTNFGSMPMRIAWTEFRNKMDELESPSPKDPLDELEDFITKQQSHWPSFPLAVDSAAVLAKIAELKGRSK